MFKFIVRCLIIVCSLIPTVVFAQDPIGYASVVVTTHRDYVDPSDGLISLREAISNADPIFDTVRFDASVNGLIITLGDSNGDGIVNYGDDIDNYMPTYAPGEARSLNIDKNVTIQGNGTWNTIVSGGTIWVDQNANSRMDNGDTIAEGVQIFHIDGIGIRVGFEDMSMVRGNAGGSDGGAIYAAGGRAIVLTIDSCNFQSNTARSGGAVYFDFGNSYVSIQDSLFDGNYATTNGGALGSTSEAMIRGSVLQRNSSDANGGAVWLMSGPLCDIEDSSLTDNRATSDGGAIYNDGRLWGEKVVFSDNRSGGNGGAICTPAENRTSNIKGVVFENNDATGNGGAIYNNGLCTMFNGVFSNNSATVDGGGVYEGQYGRSWLTNVTFLQNDAAVGNAGAYCSNAESGRSTTITNFIMVDNTTTATFELSITDAGTVNLAYGLIDGVDASLTGSTIAGTGFNNNGGMLDGSSGIAANAVFVSPTDQDGADNTWMTSDDGLRPLMTGPAVNVGNDDALVDVNRDGTPEKSIADAVLDANSPFHQGIAGVSRIRSVVDLGAYELYEIPDPTGAESVVVTTKCDVLNPVDGEISLREAIANADATHGTITFDTSINGQTILLGDSDGDGDVDGMDDIDGAGTTYASGTGDYLDINTKNITIQGNGISNTIISGGLMWSDTNSDGAIDWNEKASISGGVSIFYIRDSSVGLGGMTLKNSNSTFSNGGALNNYNSDLTINNCNFTTNYADVNGGAIFNNQGNINLNGCVFFGNQSSSSGGAILNTNASSDISDCSFEKNTSMFAGAAEFLSNSSGTIGNCTFIQNTAVNYGGALVINSSGVMSYLTISGSTFTDNTAGTTAEADTFGADGGAISCRQYTRTTIRDSIFRSNNAFDDGGAIHGTDSNSTLAMQNVVFDGNISEDSDSDGSGDGGALYIDGQFTASVFNGVFYGNQITNTTGKGGGVYTENATIYLTNCSFNGNQAQNGGGALSSIGDTAYVWIDNTVMYGDTSAANESEVHVTATTDRVSFYYSRIQGYGNPAYVEVNQTLNVGASTTAIASDPYMNSADGDGADNIWRTTDDGLFIPDASLVEAGKNSSMVDTDNNGVPETALETLTADALFGKDITGSKERIQQGSIGVGAYEVSPDPTGAAALIMTTASDRIDPYDGVITLREAIANAAPGQTITIDASMDGQVILLGDSDGDGDVDVNDDIDGDGTTFLAGTPAAIQIDNLNITGNGPENTIISGGMTWTDVNGDDRLDAGDTYAGGTGIFNFTGTNTVSGLTLMRGHATSGGAVSGTDVNVAFTNCTFSENFASNGACIYSLDGELSVSDSRFENNFAVTNGGAICSQSSTVALHNSTFSRNSTQSGIGGALYSLDGSIEITGVTFEENKSGSNGGAIGKTDAGLAIVNNCTFSGNAATDQGGAVYTADSVTVANCTLLNNSSGIYSDLSMTMINSIAWGNITEISGSGTAAMRYCIVEGGSAGTSILTDDPALGALADNGGPTQTIMPGAGSPAIGTGVMVFRDSDDTIFYEDPNSDGIYWRASDNSTYTPTSTDTCLSASDQRGVPRPQAGRADIGAFESNAIAITFDTATTPSGTGGSLSGSTTQTLNYMQDCTPVTAIAATGYHFVNWTTDGTEYSTNATLTVEDVTTDVTFTANFALITYAITTSVTGNGSISPSAATVNYGANQTFSITPAADYKLTDVQIDGESIGIVDSFTFVDVTGPHSISATFAMINGPERPVLLQPENGLTDVGLSPDISVGYMDTAIPESHLRTEWQIASDADFSEMVFNLTSETFLTELTVPDMVLKADTVYYWRVRFIDTDGYEWEWSETGSFTTAAEQFTDADGNLIPDDMEISPASDLDGNGEADISQPGMHCTTLPDDAGEICISVQDGSGTLEALSLVDPATIEDMNNRPIENLPCLFSFRVRATDPEDSAKVIIWFSEPLPRNTAWYKYDTVNGWQDFSDYAIFNEERTSVTLFLLDGWYGDADGVSNGIIVDPSGPANGKSGGGGGCFIRGLAE